MRSKQPIPILLGTTASGKTGVAIALAQAVGGEILSMDARAIYREMDIGTAKPTLKERQRVPHHLIDICDIGETFDAYQFRQMAAHTIEDVLSRGKIPIFAGGTTLYLKALTEGLFEGVSADPRLRAELEALTQEALYEQLKRVDPQTARRLKPNDRIRITRALEVQRQTGLSIGALQAQATPLPYRFMKFGLWWERQTLYARINRRVDLMIEQGLLEEVKGLLLKLAPGTPAYKTYGYQELIAYFQGECSLERAVDKIKQHTRNYAKRQLTWHRKDPAIIWLEVEGQSPQTLASQIVKHLEEQTQ